LLKMMFSSFIHLLGITKFLTSLCRNKIPLCIILIHSLVVWHLGCFHSLPIVNSAAINMGVQVSL
jgi:hypothetical protein